VHWTLRAGGSDGVTAHRDTELAAGPTDWPSPSAVPSYRELAQSYGVGPDDDRSARRHSRPPSRRVRRRRIVAAIVVVALTCVSWSYGRALTGPGNDALSIRSTEWLKDHYFAWAVDDVERWWYTHHKPKVGGVPTGALGRTIHNAAGRSSATVPAGPRHLPAPAAIPPIATGPLPGEGRWTPLGQNVNGLPAMYAAFLRPDPLHTSLVTAVAWMDPTLVKAVGYAGAVEPGGGPWVNQAPVPDALRPALLAAFNSGFKMRDARGGYYADGRMGRPLVAGGATLVISPDGTPNVGDWGRDFQLGPQVAFARQNLSLIVDGGQPVPGLASNSSSQWGVTVGNAVFVWRSGVGVTANGALVYAAGNGLSATTLAGVLARAGAVRAMELDINSAWVDFFTYMPPAAGQAPTAPSVVKLLPDMRPSTSDYLTASSRDFVAIFRRS
jgi:hypothetical protein